MIMWSAVRFFAVLVAGVAPVVPSEAIGGSVLFDAATHVAGRSSGCGKASPYKVGQTTVAHGTYAGVKWLWRVYVPKAYDKNTPMPVILQHPGWGMSAQGEQKGSGITLYA